jgi:hypothetical protein
MLRFYLKTYESTKELTKYRVDMLFVGNEEVVLIFRPETLATVDQMQEADQMTSLNQTEDGKVFCT